MAQQCFVLELELPAAAPVHYGPASREKCEAFADKRRRAKLARGVTQRDVVVVELVPISGSES